MNKRNLFIGLLALFAVFIALKQVDASDYRKVTFAQIKAEGKIWGIDLSHHQSDIDWDKLKDQKPHFIFFKATEGATHTDTKYTENYKNARKAKLIVGSYHFFSYNSNGNAQAEHFLSVAKFKAGDLPPVVDAEYRRNMPADKIVTRELVSFLKAVTTKTGKKPIIYCDYDYYKQYLDGKLKNEHLLWICDYKHKPKCEWTFWQTTDKFKIAGVKGHVDFNLFNGSKRKFEEMQF
jgi:lysozyme